LFGLLLRFGDFLLGKFDESFEDELQDMSVFATIVIDAATYLNGANIGVLGDILVLIQAILCGLSFPEVDT